MAIDKKQDNADKRSTVDCCWRVREAWEPGEKSVPLLGEWGNS